MKAAFAGSVYSVNSFGIFTLIETTLLPPMPVGKTMPQYIGLAFEGITNIHKKYDVTILNDHTPHIFMMEIRLTESTLTCCIQNNICTEAYLFKDQDATN